MQVELEGSNVYIDLKYSTVMSISSLFRLMVCKKGLAAAAYGTQMHFHKILSGMIVDVF